jgi:hypothetical protein
VSDIKDGGPAFPQPEHSVAVNPEGMTLRDYFAAKAMEAFILRNDRGLIDMPWVAQGAYKIADFMLKERGQS